MTKDGIKLLKIIKIWEKTNILGQRERKKKQRRYEP
jgi:hypothetical protein